MAAPGPLQLYHRHLVRGGSGVQRKGRRHGGRLSFLRLVLPPPRHPPPPHPSLLAAEPAAESENSRPSLPSGPDAQPPRLLLPPGKLRRPVRADLAGRGRRRAVALPHPP